MRRCALGALLLVVVLVVDVGRAAGVGAGFGDHVAEGVVRERRRLSVEVCLRGDVIEIVVGRRGRVGERVGDGRGAVQRVMRRAGHVAVGVGDGRAVLLPVQSLTEWGGTPRFLYLFIVRVRDRDRKAETLWLGESSAAGE